MTHPTVLVGSFDPSTTKSPGPRPSSIPSDILIHLDGRRCSRCCYMLCCCKCYTTKKKRKRSLWTQPWISAKCTHGAYHTLMQELDERSLFITFSGWTTARLSCYWATYLHKLHVKTPKCSWASNRWVGGETDLSNRNNNDCRYRVCYLELFTLLPFVQQKPDIKYSASFQSQS